MRLLIACQLLSLIPATTTAAELLYNPINPNFGGNAANGTYLMNQTDGQNQTRAPVVATPTAPSKTPIEQFKANLQSGILSRLSTTTQSNLFDSNGNIKLGSTLNFDLNGDGQIFSVQVNSAPVNGNVSISITDGVSNTVLLVPYTGP